MRTIELSRAAHAVLAKLLASEPIGLAIAAAGSYADLQSTEFSEELRSWFHDWAIHGAFETISMSSTPAGEFDEES